MAAPPRVISLAPYPGKAASSKLKPALEAFPTHLLALSSLGIGQGSG